MKRTILATLSLVATSQLLLTKPAGAITFNFHWTSDRPELDVPGSAIHTATGTIDINDVKPGSRFSTGSVSNVNITVTDGTNTVNFTDEHLEHWFGSIEGNSVVIEDMFFRRFHPMNELEIFAHSTTPYICEEEEIYDSISDKFFCPGDQIDQPFVSVKYRDSPTIDIGVKDPRDTQALREEISKESFTITRAQVPFGIPDYLPIGFFGAVLGMDRLKKWKNKKKEFAQKDGELKEETQGGQGL